MNEIQQYSNMAHLRNYLYSLIDISVDILKNIDVMECKEVETVGKMVSSLAEYRKNNYIELPF